MGRGDRIGAGNLEKPGRDLGGQRFALRLSCSAWATLPVPCDGHLFLGRVAIRGAQVILSAAATACGPPTYGLSFRTTDTIIATSQ